MGIFNFWKRSSEIQDVWRWVEGQAGVYNNYTSITRESVLKYPSVFRSISLITGFLSRLKFNVKEEEEIVQHWGAKVCNNPNDLMNKFVFWRSLYQSALLSGVGYALIERNPYGDPINLWLLDSETTSPNYNENTNELTYSYEFFNKKLGTSPANILVIKNLSTDGINPVSVVDVLKETFQLGINLQLHAKLFFENATDNVWVSLPGFFKSHEEFLKFKNALEATKGVSNAHKINLLQGGATIQPKQELSHADAEFIALREYENKQIASIFGLPVSFVNGSSSISYNSLSEDTRNVLLGCLEPWIYQTEQELNQKLLSEEEKQEGLLQFAIDRTKLERADRSTENNILISRLQNGLLTKNQCLKEINLPSVPEGDTYNILSYVADEQSQKEAQEKEVKND